MLTVLLSSGGTPPIRPAWVAGLIAGLRDWPSQWAGDGSAERRASVTAAGTTEVAHGGGLLEDRGLHVDRAWQRKEHATPSEHDAVPGRAGWRCRRGIGEAAHAVRTHAVRDGQQLRLRGRGWWAGPRSAARKQFATGGLGGLERRRRRVDPGADLDTDAPAGRGRVREGRHPMRAHAVGEFDSTRS